MLGTAKSFAVVRIAPRSSATTFSPASVNSFDRMPPVQPDDDDVDFLHSRCHVVLPQLRSAMLSVSCGNGLSRNFATFSRCTAITPGQPIICHPALLRLPPYIGSENIPSITVW